MVHSTRRDVMADIRRAVRNYGPTTQEALKAELGAIIHKHQVMGGWDCMEKLDWVKEALETVLPELCADTKECEAEPVSGDCDGEDDTACQSVEPPFKMMRCVSIKTDINHNHVAVSEVRFRNHPTSCLDSDLVLDMTPLQAESYTVGVEYPVKVALPDNYGG